MRSLLCLDGEEKSIPRIRKLQPILRDPQTDTKKVYHSQSRNINSVTVTNFCLYHTSIIVTE